MSGVGCMSTSHSLARLSSRKAKSDDTTIEKVIRDAEPSGSCLSSNFGLGGIRDSLLYCRLMTSTKSTSVSRESATLWPGRSRADSLTMRRRIASSHSPSSVGFR
jgi:hypothetical protein